MTSYETRETDRDVRLDDRGWLLRGPRWESGLGCAGCGRSLEHGAMAIRVKQDEQVSIFQNREGRDLEEFPLGRELGPREIETMKRPPGKDMIIFGSGSIVSQLTQHGLIDEYQFTVCPIFLGQGQPLLTGVSKSVRLDLLEAKALQSGDSNASLCAPGLDSRWG